MKRARGWILASVVLYALSCGVPALWVNGEERAFGWQALIFGWAVMQFGVVAWLANPVAAIALALHGMGERRAAAVAAAVAVALALTTWLVIRPGDLLVGYYLWQASLLALALAVTLGTRAADRGSTA